MALDEYIFGRVARYFRHRKLQAANASHIVALEPLRPRLTLLARALTGRPVEIFPAVKEAASRATASSSPKNA
ncbi:hypothetical protein, partial [uncultured Chitinophaga sp.]|uniref:hypothetical protein n=1 Tax=uncultured Chitinophaga sp. TaxID=339340 RepID=UPI00263156FD